MAKDPSEEFWKHQNDMWRRGRSSGELGYMTASGYVLKGSEEDLKRKQKEREMTTSTFEVKPGSLSLFKNDKKENDAQPDYRGSGKQLDGSEVWVAAWIKTSASGTKYMSLAITAKEQAAPAPSPKSAPDSDAPF